MYSIKVENYGNVFVRDMKMSEDFARYRWYVADKIADKMTSKKVKRGLFDTHEFRRAKMQFEDEALLLADDYLQIRYPQYYEEIEENQEENNFDYDSLVDNVTEQETIKKETENKDEDYTPKQWCQLMKKNNSHLRFWFEEYKSEATKIYTDATEEQLQSLNLPEGYVYQEGVIVNQKGDFIVLDDVENAEKYAIKEIKKASSFAALLKNIKNAVCNIFKKKKNPVLDNLVENFIATEEKMEEKTISKYPTRKLTKKEVIDANVFSSDVKEGVMKIATRKAYREILNTPIKNVNAFEINLEDVNFPPRQIDCGCGIIEIYESEFRNLIDSKYNLIKISPETSNKLTKKESEDFEFYYKKALKNVFDYSKRGKVKLTTEEHGRLLDINNRYVQLLILEEKRKTIYQKIREKQEALERELQEQQNRIYKKYLEQLENITLKEEEAQPIKVIKR